MFKRILRRDGSVILLVPKKDTQAITVEILYKIGSRQEVPANNGVSHFIEHLMFKGTDKRPHTVDIAKELDSVGAEYNAFTGKEYTGYYVMADNSHAFLAVDILSDMLHASKFDAKEMDRERGVIVEEINMYEDNPAMFIDEVFENLLFTGSALGRPIAGPRQVIQTISRQALYNYYRRYYYGGNTVIGVAGNFSEAKILRLIDKFFPSRIRHKRLAIRPIPKTRQNKAAIELIKRDLEQVQLMLGWRGVPGTDKRFLALQVLGNILGGTMSSRLFLQIRERMGLCYFIRAEVNGYEDTGYFAVHAGLNKDKIYEALQAIKAELDLIKNKGVDPVELKKAKDNIRGHLILRLESATNYLNFLAAQEIWGQRIKDLKQTLAELDRITLAQVNQLAKELVKWPQSNLAIIGPFAQRKEFLKILK
ncbi:MAG: pitrilysin family protein [Patescibacteria group bacterium]